VAFTAVRRDFEATDISPKKDMPIIPRATTISIIDDPFL